MSPSLLIGAGADKYLCLLQSQLARELTQIVHIHIKHHIKDKILILVGVGGVFIQYERSK